MGTKIAFRRPDGKDTVGYLAKAGRAKAPGVVVIQEWWGLQDQIMGICDRFAAAGYEALAPDLYAGTIVPYHDSEAANREMSSLNFLDATDQIVRGAAQYLKLAGAKVGLTGFCMGGAVTILGAIRIPELSAAVCFYGLPPGNVAKPADIRAPLQAHFANEDDWCTPKAVNDFEAALKAAGKSVEIFRYDAKHGFMNEQRLDAHERQAAELAWSRTLEFWGRHWAGELPAPRHSGARRRREPGTHDHSPIGVHRFRIAASRLPERRSPTPPRFSRSAPRRQIPSRA